MCVCTPETKKDSFSISACVTVAFGVIHALTGKGILCTGDETDKSWKLDMFLFLCERRLSSVKRLCQSAKEMLLSLRSYTAEQAGDIFTLLCNQRKSVWTCNKNSSTWQRFSEASRIMNWSAATDSEDASDKKSLIQWSLQHVTLVWFQDRGLYSYLPTHRGKTKCNHPTKSANKNGCFAL